MAYAELCARSCFSLLHGASHPEELVDAAVRHGLTALAITDRDATYGLPQAHVAGVAAGLPVLCGATVTVTDHPPVVLLAESLAGWSRLCRLLTDARAAAAKGRARVSVERLCAAAGGLTALLSDGWTATAAGPLRDAFGASLEVLWTRTLSPTDRPREARAVALARALGRPMVASQDVLYHDPVRARLTDVLTCIRRRCTLDEAGRALPANAERHLLSPAAFADRYQAHPSAIHRTLEVAERCSFRLSEIQYRYPREVVPEGFTAMAWLRQLVDDGAAERWPDGVNEVVRRQLDHELEVIADLDFPSYFLTVHDAVRWARARGILCQGRGSAANSAVCYALGVTSIDPARSNLLFERFISRERREPPDIDVDFEHERREEVIQYVYARYGRDRAAMVNEIIAWRPRSAVRDVAKVFGLSLDQSDRLADLFGHWSTSLLGDEAERVRGIGLDPRDPAVRWTLEIAHDLVGLPRHLGIHVGGFIIAEGAVIDLVPVEPASMADRTVIQWDKYAVDGLGLVKVDLLSLGMLTAIRKAFDLVAGAYGQRWALHTIPAEDPAVYDMFCSGDTIGVFQIESRAQQSMLPRLRPRCFYDLVIEVAIVRPGPIQGGMVHPYLRRRCGEEPVTYAHPALEPILARTLGVPLFQEQVMQVAVAVGGFSAGDADALRRAMGAWRKRGGLDRYGERLKEGMAARGIAPEFADAIFQQILGFGEYGFPESHSASFALLVYVSGWLKRHHPEAFCAALINSQPMGFYAPRTLIDDARRHGVEVRGLDVNVSGWDCALEPVPGERAALRLGLRLIRGLAQADADALVAARAAGPFRSPSDLAHRAGLDRHALGLLAGAGALAAVSTDRRQAAWSLQGAWTGLPLFAGLDRDEPPAPLPEEDDTERLIADYGAVGFSLERHPAELLRARLAERGAPVTPLCELANLPSDARVNIAGLVGSRQRPGTAKGVTFLSLEDETALANLVVWVSTWDRYRPVLATARLLRVEGRLQRQGDALSVLVDHAEALDAVAALRSPSRDFH
jgi:error-prone DNA polymerase